MENVLRRAFRMPSQERLLLILSFAAVYLIWGSTYLGIKIAIETLPPFLMAATRFVIAGLIMLVAGYLYNGSLPKLKTWKNGAIIGFFLLFVGNGGVVWASDKMPSGIIALLITIEPVWIIVLVWLSNRKVKIGLPVFLGVLFGILGTFILVWNGTNSTSGSIEPSGLISILLSTLCWAYGSFYASRSDNGDSAAMATGIQMLFGGVYMSLAGILNGEWSSVHLENFSSDSVYAFLYLIVFGSIIGYSAYSYLLRVANPGKVATYAYVNPLVAVLLGTFVGHEPFTLTIGISAIFLLTGVVLVLSWNPSNNNLEPAKQSIDSAG